MRDKTVKDVMTPVESVYMLEVSGTINRKTVKEVSCWVLLALPPSPCLAVLSCVFQVDYCVLFLLYS